MFGKCPGSFWEISANLPGMFQEFSGDNFERRYVWMGKFPGNVRKMSGIFPGKFHEIPGSFLEIPRKFPGKFLDIFRKFPGHFPGVKLEEIRKGRILAD